MPSIPRFTQVEQFRQQAKFVNEQAGRIVMKPGRARRTRFPMAFERQYQADLRAMLKNSRFLINELLIPRLAEIIAEADRERRNDAAKKKKKKKKLYSDAYPDDIKRIMDLVRAQHGSDFSLGRIQGIIAEQGRGVNAFNQTEMNDILGSMLGVDVIQAEPWLASEVQAFTAENVNLITSVDSAYLDQVENMVLSEVRAGTRVETLSDLIMERFGVNQSRADLIARDQTSKYHGRLAKLRQVETGVDQYKWRTVQDERVRVSHASKEGRIFDWNNPPADTGHPGEDFQCRCYAEPII